MDVCAGIQQNLSYVDSTLEKANLGFYQTSMIEIVLRIVKGWNTITIFAIFRPDMFDRIANTLLYCINWQMIKSWKITR